MLETGVILIVMGVIFALGAAGEWILSLFYRRYLRDTADMERPGKKLVKLTKLHYETSYYLNGTVHNAKTMVDGMLEHYRLAGLSLWTWHHIAPTAAFLCGVMGFAIGGIYTVGRYIPRVRENLPLSGMNALIYTLAGVSLAAMLFFWQHLLDNRSRRNRIESNLVDYFDNEKFHQLGREIALSGRIREIAGDRGRREDPGSMAAGQNLNGRAEAAAGTAKAEGMAVPGSTVGVTGVAATAASEIPETETGKSSPQTATKKRGGKVTAAAKASGKKTAKTGRANADDAGSQERFYESYEGTGQEFAGGGFGEPAQRSAYEGTERFFDGSEGWDASAGNPVQTGGRMSADMAAAGSANGLTAMGTPGGMTIGDFIQTPEADREPETLDDGPAARSVGTRKKTAAASTRARAKNVQIAQEEMEERRSGGARRQEETTERKTGLSRKKEKTAKEVIIPLNPEQTAPAAGADADSRGSTAQMEAAATMQTVPSDRAAREEELLKLLREYMGL